jgi:hypothetical protein
MSRLWQTATLFLIFALTSASVMADPLCWLRTASPQDITIKGPIQFDTEWKAFKLTAPFKAAPFVQYLYLVLKRSDFKFIELTDPNEYPESHNRWVPRNIGTGEVQLFDVRVRNSKLGWIDLEYTSTSYPPDNNHGYAGMGFTNHPDKNQFFYPQGSVIEEVHIRSNRKVVIEEIRWQADGYWKWPCRKWSEVPESEIMLKQQ